MPEDTKISPSIVELQRDMQVKNKLFIMLREEDGMMPSRELHITLKQATNLLIKAKHDFRVFCEELFFVNQGIIAAKHMSFKVLDPTQGKYGQPQQLLNQSSSNML